MAQKPDGGGRGGGKKEDGGEGEGRGLGAACVDRGSLEVLATLAKHRRRLSSSGVTDMAATSPRTPLDNTCSSCIILFLLRLQGRYGRSPALPSLPLPCTLFGRAVTSLITLLQRRNGRRNRGS